MAGSQKAVASAAPSWTASLLTLVYAACGALGIGPEQSGHEVQMALGFLILGLVNYALTWYMPNSGTLYLKDLVDVSENFRKHYEHSPKD